MTLTNDYQPEPADDALSLTSTISDLENTDEEWTAEGIIAEGKVGGETRYLVDWTGFTLKDATWEPRAHVEGLLLEQWAEQKDLQKRGLAERFDMQLWTDAWKQELTEKYRRHERRNRLREQQGLRVSEWASTLDELMAQTADYYPKIETRDEDSPNPEPSDGNLALTQKPPMEAASPAQIPLSPLPPNSLQQVTSKLADSIETLEKDKKSIKSADGLAKKAPASGQQATKTLPSAPTSVTKPQANPIAAIRPAAQRTSSGNSAPGKGMMQLMRNAKASKPKIKVTKSGTKVPSGVITKRTHDATANVFIGGKIVHKRRNIIEAASDPTKDPKLFNYRNQRIVQKGRRDMENNAPPTMPKRLISLDPNLPNIDQETRSSSSSRSPEGVTGGDTHMAEAMTEVISNSPEAMDGVTWHSPENTVGITSTSPEAIAGMTLRSSEPMAIDTVENAPPKLRKRKAVRWTDEVIREEPSLFISDNRMRSPLPPPSEPIPPPNLPIPQAPPRDISKNCQLGPNTQTVNLVFRNVPQATKSPWLDHFTESEAIVFSHLCIAQDFQANLIPGSPARACDLASGYISCSTDQVQNVVNRLRLHSQGVMCCAEGYFILCFPTKCEDWDFEKVNGTDDADSPLRFIVFQATDRVHPSAFASSSDDRSESNIGHGESLISNGLNKFLTLHHSRLVPPVMQDYGEHHYFIAFPLNPTHQTEAAFLCDWLSTSYSSGSVKCALHSSTKPGSWTEFSVDHNSKRGGIIILHEDAMECVRYLPNIREVIHSEYFPIYAFTRTTGRSRTFPSAHALDGKLGHIHLERVFPHNRKVFMMTPSFILSQPLEAMSFMQWFKDRYVKSGEDLARPARLAVSEDIDDWMSSLILEQVTKNVSRPRHVHLTDIDAWQDVWADIIGLAEKPDYLIYAPKGIDGNDEQSLVNWLGSWSIRHMDEASEVWVIGSACHDRNRMTKNVTAFQYAPGTVAEPEAVQHDFDSSQREYHSERNPDLEPQVIDYRGQNGAQQEHNNAETKKDTELTNKWPLLIPEDSLYDIKEFLQDKFTVVPGKPILYIKVNNMPITQWEDGTREYLKNQDRCRLGYERWIDFCAPSETKNLNKTLKRINTFGGFFYTIDQLVRNDNVPDGVSAKFRPWIAFLRPLNPHRPTEGRDGELVYGASQLLIWDPGYRGRFHGRETILEEELVDGQRQLMRLVTARTKSDNWRMPLSSVRLGWEPFENTALTHPVDLCLHALMACERDTRLHLPAPDDRMRGVGWTFVEPWQGPREPPSAEDHRNMHVEQREPESFAEEIDEIFTIPDPGFDVDEHIPGADEMKFIFHPPRSTRKASERPRISTCENLLYRTINFDNNDKYHHNDHYHHNHQPQHPNNRHHDEVLSHRFQNTTTWYEQQVYEGRDYKNILVVPFFRVFEEFGIPFHKFGYRPGLSKGRHY